VCADQPEAQVVEIHPDCKYAIMFEEHLTDAEMEHLLDDLSEWWTTDKPFMILWGCKLVKVRDEQGN
jgi:hypothetical protein